MLAALACSTDTGLRVLIANLTAGDRTVRHRGRSAPPRRVDLGAYETRIIDEGPRTTMPERIYATYRIETPGALEEAAARCGEQSTGTFVPVPGETRALHCGTRRGWRRITPEAEVGKPPGRARARQAAAPGYRRAGSCCRSRSENMGTALPNLLATVAGNLFELSQLSGIRLETWNCRRPSPPRIRARSSGSTAPPLAGVTAGRSSARSSSRASASRPRRRPTLRDLARPGSTSSRTTS